MRSETVREIGADGRTIRERQTVTRFDRGPRYRGPWEAMMMFSGEGFAELEERLADHSLGMQAVRVLIAMCRSVRVHDGNRVPAGRKDLALRLGMSESNVSGALKALVDCGFIEKPQLKFGYYTVSPRFFWCGTTNELKKALKERGMLGEDGMMKAQEPKKAA